MIERATPEKLAKLRREGRLTPCYPVKEIHFLPGTGLNVRYDCYVSYRPHFIAIWGPGQETPDYVNINCVLSMHGVGPSTDGRTSYYSLVPLKREE